MERKKEEVQEATETDVVLKKREKGEILSSPLIESSMDDEFYEAFIKLFPSLSSIPKESIGLHYDIALAEDGGSPCLPYLLAHKVALAEESIDAGGLRKAVQVGEVREENDIPKTSIGLDSSRTPYGISYVACIERATKRKFSVVILPER